MKTLHSVVLRAAVQKRFGHEYAAYKGTSCKGIIWYVLVRIVPGIFKATRAYVLKDKVPRTAVVQCLHPVDSAGRRVNNRRFVPSADQGVGSDIVCTDPQRVHRLRWVQSRRPVRIFLEVQRQLALEHRKGRAEGDIVRARRARAGEREQRHPGGSSGVRWPRCAFVPGVDDVRVGVPEGDQVAYLARLNANALHDGGYCGQCGENTKESHTERIGES